MKLSDVAAAHQLTSQRAKLAAINTRLLEEPLRLVLGKGSGEIEVQLTDQALARIQREACATLAAAIAEIDTRLEALGVEA